MTKVTGAAEDVVFSHNARAAADGSIAKALGLEVPHNLLVLADKVIE